MTLTYSDSGVDTKKAAETITDLQKFLSTRPKSPALLTGIGPFAACASLKTLTQQMEDPILVTSCDGVGTKVKLAIDWNGVDTIGEDLVGMNVNDLLCAGALPAFFLDYYACSHLEPSHFSTVLRSIQKGCEEAECFLIGGETAEMPGIYQKKDIDLAGFVIGFGERKNLLGPGKVMAGDLLLGIHSSGIHSNGYSLVRKLVDKEKIEPGGTTPYSKKTWKEALLAPTLIYVRALKNLFPKLHAAAHITGGGLYENLPRVLPKYLAAEIESKQWEFPGVFQWLQESSGLSTEQMLHTFNCGMGMILVVDQAHLSQVEAQVQMSGFQTSRLGKVVERKSPQSPIHWLT